jgi:hypothetical protein
MSLKIDDIDVFDSMRALIHDNVDLNNRAAVEKALINPYKGTRLSDRFVNWSIKAAKANRARGGLPHRAFGGGGFVPKQQEPRS